MSFVFGIFGAYAEPLPIFPDSPDPGKNIGMADRPKETQKAGTNWLKAGQCPYILTTVY
jgi:hypothetical protein